MLRLGIVANKIGRTLCLCLNQKICVRTYEATILEFSNEYCLVEFTSEAGHMLNVDISEVAS